METYTGSISHLVVELVEDSSMVSPAGTTGTTTHWVQSVDNRSLGTHTGSTSHWVEQVDNSSMGTHTRSVPH